MSYLAHFWSGVWRGGTIGAVYTFLAMLAVELALSIGLSSNQAMCLGLLVPQVVMISMYHLHLYSLGEIARGQAESQLVREILIKVLK